MAAGDEQGLVERVRRGDHAAFEALFAAHAASLYSYANRFTQSRPAAQDIVHDVFVRVWERRESWIDIHNFRAQKYGNELHIDCHLTLPNYFDLNRVHLEVKLVDELINKEVTKTELFIHTDPCIPECCHYCSMPNCPIRSERKTEEIAWTMDKIIRNKKYFE